MEFMRIHREPWRNCNINLQHKFQVCCRIFRKKYNREIYSFVEPIGLFYERWPFWWRCRSQITKVKMRSLRNWFIVPPHPEIAALPPIRPPPSCDCNTRRMKCGSLLATAVTLWLVCSWILRTEFSRNPSRNSRIHQKSNFWRNPKRNPGEILRISREIQEGSLKELLKEKTYTKFRGES